MKYKDPLITIALLTYNHEKYIHDCLFSILEQTYPRIELIVLDDGSSDKTVEIIEHMSTLIEARMEHFSILKNKENNGNIPENVNRLIRSSNGDFFKLFSGDDVMLSEMIEKLYLDLKNTDCTISYSNMYIVPDSFCRKTDSLNNMDYSTEFSEKPSGEEDDRLFNRLFYENQIPAPTIMYEKDVFERNGLFDEDAIYEDYEFNLRTSRTEKYYYDDVCLAYYRRAMESINNFEAGACRNKIITAMKADRYSIEKYEMCVTEDERVKRWEKYVTWYYQLCRHENMDENKLFLEGLAKKKKLNVDFTELNRCATNMELLEKWEEREIDAIFFNDFFENEKVLTVALYGYGDLGRKVYSVLKDGNICVEYIIDRRAKEGAFPLVAYTMQDKLPPVDCVIVTVVGIKKELFKDIETKTGAKVFSLESLIIDK